jgi:transposase
MPHIHGTARDEVLLFPPSLDEYITDENSVRFIDAFVDQLDLQDLGFARAVASPLGRPAYHPGDLLKLYIYGYLNRLRSSRLLEREARRNVELIWLIKKLTPDFKTIADFRKDNLVPIQKVCREFTLLCKALDLFGGELVAVDGSKFKAVNNRKRNFTPEKLTKALEHIDAKIAEYLQALDTADAETPSRPDLTAAELQERITQFRERKQQYQEIQQVLVASGEGQISLTDPDSRAMPVAQGLDVCYNVEVVVDSKHKLIVTHEVTTAVTDKDQLAPMATAAKAVLGVEELDAVADKGFYNGEQVKRCNEANIQTYIPQPHTSRNQHKGLFTKDDFRYDKEHDRYWCPQGEQLTFRFETEEKGRATRYYATSACGGCPIKARCTENKGGRRITRWAEEHVLEAMAERVQANPAIMKQRKELIEHIFGTMKRSMDQGYFLLRTRKKVATEMSLTVVAYNLKRVIAIMGVKGLIAGLIEYTAGLWGIVCWLIQVPLWCKWIRRAAWWGPGASLPADFSHSLTRCWGHRRRVLHHNHLNKMRTELCTKAKHRPACALRASPRFRLIVRQMLQNDLDDCVR